jgi:hypothetical protein
MILSDNQKQKIFMWSFIIIYVLYIITIFDLVYINSQYISNARTIIETVSCILLIIRFNPYVIHTITNFDKTMIFSVATFLLCNIIISELYLHYSSNPMINTLDKLKLHTKININKI